MSGLSSPPDPAGPGGHQQSRKGRGERVRRRLAAGTGRTDRSNRIILCAVGVVLAAAGAVALLSSGGAFGWDQPSRIYGHLKGNASAYSIVWAGVGSLVCLVLTVLGLGWAGRQFAPNRDRQRLAGAVPLQQTPQGRTTLEASRFAGAVGQDLAAVQGVSAARVRLRSLDPPRLVANVDMSVDVDAAGLAHALDRPLTRASRALGVDDVETEVRVRFVDRPSSGRVQ